MVSPVAIMSLLKATSITFVPTTYNLTTCLYSKEQRDRGGGWLKVLKIDPSLCTEE